MSGRIRRKHDVLHCAAGRYEWSLHDVLLLRLHRVHHSGLRLFPLSFAIPCLFVLLVFLGNEFCVAGDMFPVCFQERVRCYVGRTVELEIECIMYRSFASL
jgi:hypothetical protein